MAISVVMLKVGDPSGLRTVRDFYTEHLDLTVTTEERDVYAFLDGPSGARLALHVGTPAENPDAVSLYFEVDDVDALHARLGEAGIEFVLPPQDRYWGGRVMSFLDPVGHMVKPFHSLGDDAQTPEKVHPLCRITADGAPPPEA